MKENKKAIIQRQEELLARLKTQSEFISNFEKEIFENINQVLCLVRLNISNLDFSNEKRSAEILEQSGNLIGKAIGDLRNLAKEARAL